MKVLIADDHWAYRAGLMPLFKQMDPDVSIDEACSFDDALTLLSKSDQYDLILLDLLMPDMEPFDGLKAVHGEAPDSPIIVISVIEDRRDVLHCIDLGATGYIPKTANRDEILTALQRVSGGEIWIPRALLGASDTAISALRVSRAGQNASNDPFSHLTTRQREVLRLLARGQTNSEIAQELGLSVFTVKLHVSSILKGLNVSNRTEAARLFLDHSAGPNVNGSPM